MSNNYYDAVGVVTFVKATPVVQALFGDFILEGSTPSDTQFEIATLAEMVNPQWDDIHERLRELSKTLSLQLPDDAQDTIEEQLFCLGSHFGQDDNADLLNLIDNYAFDNDADLEVLYTLARYFDDGHGIKSVHMEGARHGDRPVAGTFGGAMVYYGAHFWLDVDTGAAVAMAANIDELLAAGDISSAGARLQQAVERLIAGVAVDSVRDELRVQLGKALLAQHGGAAATKSFAVNGRIPGSDEDTCHVIDAVDATAAVAAFEAEMYCHIEDVAAREADREAAIKRHGSAVYITSVCYADVGDIITV
ncbi:hypothetical protein [Duganella vulcania]|uniref:Uncharacterized protein n=1 Tax=Duganella vulcania TaxID=2692166 RepID=A0A845GIC2_9BURK|nr:hypothetical protein [Duganella vulcania]MYM92419.1 hypothetical protein [Duganella vulcania]